MPAVIDIHRLSPHHLAPAGEVVGRALFGDPTWAYVIPSPERRARDLVWLVDIGIRYGERFGDVFVTGSPVTGAAVWLPPGETTVTPDRLDQVGFAAAPARLGAAAFARFDGFIGRLGALHAMLMPGPHWYLMMIGVEPSLQGRGTGSLLMQPVLERADREGASCYLETARERNLGFFGRHGFDIVREVDLPGAPRAWLMVRQPRRWQNGQ